MMLKEEGIYPKSFDIFYSIMKEHFVKNKDIFPRMSAPGFYELFSDRSFHENKSKIFVSALGGF